MDNLVAVLIGGAWLAILGVLVWGIASGWRRQLGVLNALPLPIFRQLEQEGLTVARAQQAVGVDELAIGVSRCASCASLAACQARMLEGGPGARRVGCPNSSLFDRARR